MVFAISNFHPILSNRYEKRVPKALIFHLILFFPITIKLKGFAPTTLTFLTRWEGGIGQVISPYGLSSDALNYDLLGWVSTWTGDRVSDGMENKN